MSNPVRHRNAQHTAPIPAVESTPFSFPTAWSPSEPGVSGRAQYILDLGRSMAGLHKLAADAGASPEIVLLAGHLAVLRSLTPDHISSGIGVPTEQSSDGFTLRRVTIRRGRCSWGQWIRQVADDVALGHDVASDVMASGTGAGACFVLGQVGGSAATGRRPTSDLFEGYDLLVEHVEGGLRLDIANPAATSSDQARLTAMYHSVFERMVDDPDGDCSIALLSADERHQVLERWARGRRADRANESVAETIAAQSAVTPDRPAVVALDGTVSYRQLDQRSNQISRALTAGGHGDETLVGVHLGRIADLPATILGIWKAGLAYLPLDPSLPQGRLRAMAGGVGRCPLVVTTSDLEAEVSGFHTGEILILDSGALDRYDVSPVGIEVEPEQLAYVIYTSGSTGTPKGVMVSHEGLSNYIHWTIGAYASDRKGGAPVFSSISFDLGIPNLLTPLAVGQPVHMLPDDLAIADLGSELVARGPFSFVKMTPGHLDLLTYQLTEPQVRDLAGVVVAAGDTFTANLAARWLQLAGPEGTAVATEYGPTEITIGNSGTRLCDVPETELVPLGEPIPGTTMYVLTEYLEPTPIGVPGEVYIGGLGVTRGYLDRPEVTAERYVPDPYGQVGTRLYRTGDIARWLPDGSLDFLGRSDHQIKIRGYRVELGEIQATLCQHRSVRDAIVAATESDSGGQKLVAYVVLESTGPLDPTALGEHLALSLPDHMIPSTYFALDRVPLTQNGKLDRSALPIVL